MTLTRVPRRACSGVMILALPFLVLIPAIIKLERRSRVCTLGHLVPHSTARAARCVYGALVIPSHSEQVPLPSLLARRPASQRGILSSSMMRGCHETQGAPRP